MPQQTNTNTTENFSPSTASPSHHESPASYPMQLLEHEAIRSMETRNRTLRSHVTLSMTASVLHCTCMPPYSSCSFVQMRCSTSEVGALLCCVPIWGRMTRRHQREEDTRQCTRASAQNSVARKENCFSLTCPRLCTPQTVSAQMHRITIVALANPPRAHRNTKVPVSLWVPYVCTTHISDTCHVRS